MPLEESNMVARQANLTSQIEAERLAANKWWEDFGLCYIEGSKMEDFTYENRIKKLQAEYEGKNYDKVSLHTSNQAYGGGNPYSSCGIKNYGIKRDHSIG